jgi:hypothetical protein
MRLTEWKTGPLTSVLSVPICRVAGAIKPTSVSNIRFEVSMPVTGWSGLNLIKPALNFRRFEHICAPVSENTIDFCDSFCACDTSGAND